MEEHATGAALLAISEGDGKHQPPEEVLAHVFSCPECSHNLHEMRVSLSEMNPDLVVPSLDDDALPGMDMTFADHSSENEARARRFLITVGVICVAVVVLALLGTQLAGSMKAPVTP